MTTSEFIAQRRKELGLTLEEVGKACGVGKSTVKKWEDGFISNMKRDKIAALAAVLKVSPLELRGESAETDTKKQPVPELSETDPVEEIVKQLTNKLMQLDDTRLLELNDYLSYLEWKMQKERQKK